MTRPRGCRFCAAGAEAGPLRPVAGDGSSRHWTRSRRAAAARLDRVAPVLEHAACLEAAELADDERRAWVATMRDRLKAVGTTEALLLIGDVAGAIPSERAELEARTAELEEGAP